MGNFERTKQHPVDSGVENAKEQFDDASSGEYKISENDFSKLKEIFREIWEEKIREGEIQDEFSSALFELVALIQFHRLNNGEQLWDKAELERVVDSFWEIVKRWFKPSTPQK